MFRPAQVLVCGGIASLTVRTPPFPSAKILLPIRPPTARSGEPSTLSGHFMGSQMTFLGSGVICALFSAEVASTTRRELGAEGRCEQLWSLVIGMNLVRFVASDVEDRRFRSVFNGVCGIVVR